MELLHRFSSSRYLNILHKNASFFTGIQYQLSILTDDIQLKMWNILNRLSENEYISIDLSFYRCI